MIIFLTTTIVTVAVQYISSTTRAVVATDSVITDLLTSTIISTTFIDICVIIGSDAVKFFQVVISVWILYYLHCRHFQSSQHYSYTCWVMCMYRGDMMDCKALQMKIQNHAIYYYSYNVFLIRVQVMWLHSKMATKGQTNCYLVCICAAWLWIFLRRFVYIYAAH